MDDKNDDETWIQDQLQGEDDMDPELINTILTISLSQFRVSKGLNKQTKTASQLWKYIPYMQLLPKHQCCGGTEVEAHKERPRKKSYCLEFQPSCDTA